MVISANSRVESLAKSGIHQILKEYIRTQNELTTITNIFDEEKNQQGPQVPTIDLNDINSNDPKIREKCSHELIKAATEWGVIYLVNHGISNSNDLINRVKAAGESFFDQPVETILLQGRFEGTGQLEWLD